MISERGLAVLHAIVNDFVSDGEPVGSKSIVERHSFGVSAATIRNEMAILEEEDLIIAPHTSSGRIPSDKGYRLYVDTLEKIQPLTRAQRVAIERFLGEAEDLDDVMSRTVRLLASLTNQVAVVQYPALRNATVRQIDLIPVAQDRVLCVLITSAAVVEQQVVRLPFAAVDEEWVHALQQRIASELVGLPIDEAKHRVALLTESLPEWAGEDERDSVVRVLDVVDSLLDPVQSQRITVSGTANLTRRGESRMNLAAVLEAIEEQVTLLRLIQELVTDQRGVGVSIGQENIQYGLSDATLIATQYDTGGDGPSRLGVLGPTRMDYAGNISAMRAVSRYLGNLLGESTHP